MQPLKLAPLNVPGIFADSGNNISASITLLIHNICQSQSHPHFDEFARYHDNNAVENRRTVNQPTCNSIKIWHGCAIVDGICLQPFAISEQTNTT